MMHKRILLSFALALVAPSCGTSTEQTPAHQPAAPSVPELQTQVAEAERAFARTMADRDHAAFVSFLSDEAIFFSGSAALRGKQAVADAWKSFYDSDEAPFSWTPEQVQVLESGTLAHSSGPVLDPRGKRVGTFNSIWRLESDGKWRVVFDKGCDACP